MEGALERILGNNGNTHTKAISRAIKRGTHPAGMRGCLTEATGGPEQTGSPVKVIFRDYNLADR